MRATRLQVVQAGGAERPLRGMRRLHVERLVRVERLEDVDIIPTGREEAMPLPVQVQVEPGEQDESREQTRPGNASPSAPSSVD